MKSCAITCVIGWLSFWTFGAVAVLTPDLSETQMVIATLLAFGGLMAGMTSYLKLCRECK
ncbi:MAG: hypothetical protein RI946_161 [Pseudomonadota bacterium]|jgi:uncharacterized membrane protein YwaF|nr:hypothetical protein [Paracoccaceae bacterium]